MTKSVGQKLVTYLILLCLPFLSITGCKSEDKAEEGKKSEKLTAGPPKGGDFTLQSAGVPFSLHDMKGKVVLIFFGYTSCPTACPTSLAIMADAFSRLSLEELDKVQGIFISFDPERDTVEALKEYTGYFHPKIIGLTGKPEEIRKIADRYGAYFIKALQKESEMGYAFSHSTETYLVSGKGTLSEIYSDKTDALTLSEAIRRHLLKK
ncbi:MAG: SCO family protein [Proteobacteria bacterium]|nr:SCO family protein [Pseudomonadota bacterium]